MSLVQRSWRIPSQRALYSVVRLIDVADVFAFGRSLLAHMGPMNLASTRPQLQLEDAVQEIVFDLRTGVIGNYLDILLNQWSTWQPLLQRVHTLTWAPKASNLSELNYPFARIVACVGPPSLMAIHIFVCHLL